MKKSLHITAIIDHPGFLEDIVEKLAMRHTYDYNSRKLPHSGEILETSSTQTYVSGTMVIDYQGQHLNMPFVTNFLFTCVKRSEDTYSLEWGISMS
ncbi:MAG TPA: hypothetical protein VFP97_11660 [Chitinophagaceae bacterium]|nr:hypothetical protein [Chitinophagaceae bacterium]